MNAKVRVVADATTGSVINVSENNPEYGFVRLEQTRTHIDSNGFLRRKVINALVHGTVEELQAAGFFANQELPGTILIKESMEPFNKKNPERDLKIGGNTGILCTVDGAPIYRKTIYSLQSNVEDVLIQHTNTEELRTAYAKRDNSVATITANTDFDNI
jgi:hypothetical protein